MRLFFKLILKVKRKVLFPTGYFYVIVQAAFHLMMEYNFTHMCATAELEVADSINPIFCIPMYAVLFNGCQNVDFQVINHLWEIHIASFKLPHKKNFNDVTSLVQYQYQ